MQFSRLSALATLATSAATLASAVSVFLITLTPAAYAGEAMNSFSPTGGEFSVIMEGTPITKSGLAAGQIATCYAHDEKDGGYWITSGLVPNLTGTSPEVINTALNGSATGAVAGMKATETARYTVNLQNTYPGRQIEGLLPNNQGCFRMRIFLVGNKLYQMVVVGSKEYLNRPEPVRFMNSLAMKSAATTTPATRTATSGAHTTTIGSTNSLRHDQMAADMQKHREEMQAHSAALHQKVMDHQNSVRKDLDHARARATGYYQ